MKIKDSVALVTGANRGLGRAFAAALLAGGARKVYAAARDPASVTLAGVTPVRLDVTNAQQAAALARELGDVSLLINNAGILRGTGLLEAGSVEAARAEMETHFFGPLQLSQAFAPVLARNGGGAILNVLSVLSWISMPGASTYCASKAAEWSLTNGLRNELRAQGTQVVGLHVGYMDTDMVRGVDAAKTAPEDVVRQAFAVLESGGYEVLADEISRQVRQGLSAEPAVYAGS